MASYDDPPRPPDPYDPDYLPPSRPARSGAVTAVGVLSLLLAVLVFAGCALALVAVTDDRAMDQMRAEFNKNPELTKQIQQAGMTVDQYLAAARNLMTVIGWLGVVYAGLLVIGGVGVIRRSPAGRIVIYICAVGAVLISLLAGCSGVAGAAVAPGPGLILMLAIAAGFLGYAVFAIVALSTSKNAAEFRRASPRGQSDNDLDRPRDDGRYDDRY